PARRRRTLRGEACGKEPLRRRCDGRSLMKVRLIAEEYSIHASLRARIPTRCAALLCSRLRLPLAGRSGIGPCDSLYLCGKTVLPVVAGATITRSRGRSAPAPTCADLTAIRRKSRLIQRDGCSFVRREGHAARLGVGSAQGTRPGESCSGIRRHEASASSSAAAAGFAAATTSAATAGTTDATTEPAASASPSSCGTGRKNGC